MIRVDFPSPPSVRGPNIHKRASSPPLPPRFPAPPFCSLPSPRRDAALSPTPTAAARPSPLRLAPHPTSSSGSPRLKSLPEKRHLNLTLHREAEPPSCAAPRSPFWATHGGGVSVEAPRESGAREGRENLQRG